MNASLLLENLLRWSLQIALLVTAGALVPRLLRLKMPNARLVFGQVVLLICLLLPAIRPWRQEIVRAQHTAPQAVVTTAPQPAPNMRRVFSTPEAVLALITAVTLLRVAMLLFGLLRLRRYRIRSMPLNPAPTWASEADVRVSADVTGPVTFGFRRPVVLVPERFRELGAEMQDAILCHEILHVRRHDWLFTAAEELIRALVWFHPAIWWLLREVQLLREEAVDREVVEMTKSRDGYIDALLLIAGAAQSDLAPAPLFLRRQHLKRRVASLLKEVRMSNFRSVSAFAASLTLVAASCWFITSALPLRAAPQVVADTPGVSVNTMGAEVVRRGPVIYPPEAISKGVQGTVVANLKLNAAGAVTDASILSGPEELRKAVLQSVLNWIFSASAAANIMQEVNVSFTAPPPASRAQVTARPEESEPLTSRVVKEIRMIGLSDESRAQIESRLPLHVGDTFTIEKNRELADLLKASDARVMFVLDPGHDLSLLILPKQRPAAALGTVLPPPPQPVRRDTPLVEPVSKVTPVYPPLAKAARVQGTVSFEATIGADGTVKNLQLVSGPPLLVQAAMNAVKQWMYPPSVNEIMTPIDVTFTLAE